MSDFWEKYLQQESERKNEARGFLYATCEHLKAQGIHVVNFSYDGSGDSGWITDVVARGEGGTVIPLPREIQQELEGAIVSFLPGGWEINEGSFGEAHLKVAEAVVEFDHNDRGEGEEPEHDEWTY